MIKRIYIPECWISIAEGRNYNLLNFWAVEREEIVKIEFPKEN